MPAAEAPSIPIDLTYVVNELIKVVGTLRNSNQSADYRSKLAATYLEEMIGDLENEITRPKAEPKRGA